MKLLVVENLLEIDYGTIVGAGCAVVFALGWSSIANCTIPFALTVAPPPQARLGTGMFFGGSWLAVCAAGIAVAQFGAVAPIAAAIGRAIGFILAGLCVWSECKLLAR